MCRFSIALKQVGSEHAPDAVTNRTLHVYIRNFFLLITRSYWHHPMYAFLNFRMVWSDMSYSVLHHLRCRFKIMVLLVIHIRLRWNRETCESDHFQLQWDLGSFINPSLCHFYSSSLLRPGCISPLFVMFSVTFGMSAYCKYSRCSFSWWYLFDGFRCLDKVSHLWFVFLFSFLLAAVYF